jgi:serine/threonine-protein phosphatase 4 regulatory subunit 2
VCLDPLSTRPCCSSIALGASRPPFTIQRICELCLRPTQHYNSVGKYIRAVEKALLVTSTNDAFPPASPTTSTVLPGVSGAALIGAGASAPATPLFSPIPFLHDDARRSTSRSPPPLALEPTADLSTTAVAGAEGAVGAAAEPMRALGMVDELDDPSPGHMSDTPTALSAVTTLPAEGGEAIAEVTTNGTSGSAPSGSATRGTGRPLLGSLGDRFVAGGQESAPSSDDMDLDDAEDKENRA